MDICKLALHKPALSKTPNKLRGLVCGHSASLFSCRAFCCHHVWVVKSSILFGSTHPGVKPHKFFTMFINLSNHPSAKWGEKQLAAAAEFGELCDRQFPTIPADASDEVVRSMAADMAGVISATYGPTAVVHVMGEMGYTHALVTILKAAGVRCFHSTTERNVVENLDGSKTVVFEFVQFRSY